MSILLLDLGNTRLKWALLSNGQLGSTQSATLDQALSLPPTKHAFWASSNADPDTLSQLHAALEATGARITRMGPPTSDALLTLAYPDPTTLGVDRWLGMRAARRRVEGAFLLASVGTALTIDAVDSNGQHLGGTIAPTHERMREALLVRARHLRQSDGHLHTFADNTADAVHSGALLAAAALIERLHDELTQRLDSTPPLLLSGGGAEALLPALRKEVVMCSDLVLQGLAGDVLALSE